ncbi:hypothetical protein [Flavobacterium sp.]|uniref:hypothetical protein n=1 Tax=Flavobacterium sp. TaxID=239 RepID=UPI00248830EC|nr:hypothetical protein [Flavobacterium sp.]MDI1316332.1 hypothetical protein [Flavobacterium sp.]
MKKILPFFSYAFHPIFIPLFGTFFYVLWDSHYFTMAQCLILFLQIIIITILLPIAFFCLLRTFGKVETVMLSDISQRKIPLILQIMLFAVLIEKSITFERFPSLYLFFFGGIISSILAFVFLFGKIKASIHMIGISSLTVYIIGLSIHNEINTINTVAFFVIINGVVASSRLVMKAHSNKELLIGFFCGAIPQCVLFYFWL